jgi:hypothetical protein
MIDFKRHAWAAAILLSAPLANAATVALAPGSNASDERRHLPQFACHRGHCNDVGSAASASGNEHVVAFENTPRESSAPAVDEVSLPGTLELLAIGAIALAVLRRRIKD